MNDTELAIILFKAFAENDLEAARSLCPPDMKAIQNNNPAMDLDTLLGFSDAVSKVVRNFRYEDVIRSVTDTGFVEEHSVRGTLPDDSELHLAVCVVAEVEEGKIKLLREYIDTSSAAGLLQALA